MMEEKRLIQAKKNFENYLREGLLKKEKNDLSKEMYIKNSYLSLQTAIELENSSLKPHMWVIVISYYSMFYIANAVLLHLGYKTQDKIVHKVTMDALIVLVQEKLRKELLEEYELIQQDALDIASIKAEELITNYSLELTKRSTFQYNMLESIKETKAKTSIKRAQEFIYEMNKLLQ
jgi:uncharacterized protein (UPF0332 family)